MKYLILFTLVAMWSRQQPTDPVRVEGGLLRGTINPGGYRQYMGIPYARTDDAARFKAPLPTEPWEGVYEAIEENVRCLQRMGKSYLVGQVDCLRLNVYTPLQVEEPLPVMVYIHGGGFFEGSGLPTIYGPEYLVTKGVIVVTINYRLNIQGYLCLRIPEAPGNAGMKDQVAALRWIKRNIRAFGGDPDNVTLFGESAGAASVSYHILSPMSKGLFHKAIIQSGSSLSAWAHQYNPVHMASLLSKTMGHSETDPLELYNIFMNKSNTDLIMTRVPRKRGNILLTELLYSPCVENKLPGVEAFLTELPYNLLKRGEYNKVPTIIGANSEEGLLFVAGENDTTYAAMSFENSMPKDLVFPSETEKKEAADKLGSLLLNDEKISKEVRVKLSKLHGEPYFNYPVAKETDLALETNENPIYSYRLKYGGLLNVGKIITGFFKVPGATHADDLFYLFKPSLLPTPTRFFEMTMVNRMTTMWTNFAKFGNPTPVLTELLPVQWHPVKKESPESFVIDAEFSTAPLWDGDSMLFWRELYEKYRRKETVN
ncbi:juvenile hormone esterase [Plutella xylostella]|uniref:juvenile hormone esterase n=1 Tax=Plutella xylostella TaxID=51655 RepID=UPI002032614B|nr:juvenile hormone esterase [Plutella xylostella]